VHTDHNPKLVREGRREEQEQREDHHQNHLFSISSFSEAYNGLKK
tara:strand:- start:1099 stop:1233 length:135 start_codon:yes stop_codon:yes gene_type:complete